MYGYKLEQFLSWRGYRTKKEVHELREKAIVHKHSGLVDELEERAAKMASGRLYLVDLAASESFETVHDPSVGKASPPAGDHFGLLALGKVLTALAGGRTHVPYREATLTKLLQQALP